MRPRGRYLATTTLLLLAAGGPTGAAPAASGSAEPGAAEVVLTFADPAIDESSGLVVERAVLRTVNDSGDGPVVYTVDRATGRTVGVTTFAHEDPVDVEALARGPAGSLWVGDIGDNARVRDHVTLHRLPAAPGGAWGRPVTYGLRYPDGSHDAEALLVHPRTGRVLVVTKRPLFGGQVLRAPARLRPGAVHALRRVGRVPGMVTDGAFLPDGRGLVLRTYGTAAVYSYPGLRQLATWTLPEQDQGEGVAIGPDGRIYLSTEGARSDVLAMEMPAAARAAVRAAPGGHAGTPSSAPSREPVRDVGRGAADVEGGPGAGRPDGYVAAAVLGVLLVGCGLVGVAVRAARRPGRRRR
jgi:hypothetical protein